MGAAPGDLIELTAASGPATRLWIEAFDPALDDVTVVAAKTGPHCVRWLAAGRP